MHRFPVSDVVQNQSLNSSAAPALLDRERAGAAVSPSVWWRRAERLHPVSHGAPASEQGTVQREGPLSRLDSHRDW